MSEELTPEEWVLAFVLAGNPSNPNDVEIRGKLLFIKEFFVFVKEIKLDLDTFFNFIPFDYGPFSFQLASILDHLIKSGLISVSEAQVKTGKRYDYKLTPLGAERSRGIYEAIDPNIRSRLEKLRSDATKMGYFSVLRYVYSRYPEYTIASKIIRDVK